jgi:hypothetical protein
MLPSVLAACALACAVNVTMAQELFRDQLSSGTGWGVNANNADSSATFGYDYSADAIPEAPNSRGGDAATSGVKLEANINSGTFSVLTVYPTGQNFTGNYQLRFDAWINFDADERINGGSAGTTEFIGGGIGYDNTSADIGPGAQIIATGDGGSGSDWRAFADGVFLAADEMAADDRNGANAYYSDFLPGISPPAGQSQVSFPAGVAGSPSFQWITLEINSVDGLADIYIEKPGGDRLQIALFNYNGSRPFTSDGNIGLVYADFFTSVSPRPDLTFGLIDNVEVNVVPEPATFLLSILGLLGMAIWRRKA